ncbi:DUF1738 domain-containing protein [Methanoplanus sp. FWC-SCC4]|uniref:DUF1738 domain-containing protein n=1 Tax=Methanochimaera problematica TaxID=2609417 RepID=A0AA97FEF8_9EURY|nr:zincin-like metallopeptidase domain-containing protein [Methanoplanus sp. FWC-SCC4]WOF16773.1 DUF1738 domain-containing protein [Methanoplanus sp. FWC-SCC4]
MPSVYEIVQDRIIKQLESGVVPWQKTWQDMNPVNILTGKEYRGINRLLLAGHTHWGTFRQIREAGGSVRKGEKASGIVLFWSKTDTKKTVNDQGDDVIIMAERERPIVRYYPVFNFSQCEGIEPEAVAEITPVVSCEEIIKRNKHLNGIGSPSYSPDKDIVRMPPMDMFRSREDYYAAYFHELTHWTGHSSRLKRSGICKTSMFGSETYSREELTAEMGSAFLCAMCGIDTDPVRMNSASYIAGWLEHIREGSARDLISAAGDAQRAVDFLEMGRPSP